jgi:DNA polymerase V
VLYALLTWIGKCSFFVLMPELVPIMTYYDPSTPTITVGAFGVSAGFPSPAGDDLEDEIDPIGWVVRRPGSTFWYRAEGDCLADIGKKRLGRVMLFVVDGAFTAKVLGKRDGQYWLDPANRSGGFKSIPYHEDMDCHGVLAGVVRRCGIE